jgi:drug/metabolite transporter (DMT)-like permease
LRPRATALPLVAALTTVVLWASAFVGIRAAGHGYTAGTLSLGRLAVGSAALGVIVAVRREGFPARRDLPRLAAIGILWFGAYNLVLNQAERLVDAGTTAMLVNVGPILIAVLAGLLLGEGFPKALFAGIGVAFAGVVIIGLALREDGRGSATGAALCVLAAALWATAVTLQKPLLARASALQTTWVACTIGMVACLPFAGSLVDQVGSATGGQTAWIVYLGIFPTAIAFTTWAFALARMPAGRLGVTTYLVPPIVVVLSAVVLGEHPPVLALAGGALCLAGVAVSRRAPRPTG